MNRVLITGTNRGLGLEFARQMLARGDRVFATARHPENAKELAELVGQYGDHVTIIAMDVSALDSIDKCREEVRRHTDALDLLINNAGISPRSPGTGGPEKLSHLGTVDMDAILGMFRTNSVAPLIIAQKFLDLLKRGNSPKIVSLSSVLGSLTLRTVAHGYAYSASKSALNMLMHILGFDVHEYGIISVIVHPGWVQTGIGGKDAPLMPEQSIKGLLKVIDGLTMNDSGKFISWEGKEIPW
jgi:NAD(P)-dependent dehydrogenase (short-subunit alcohol dehydrogenase family)